MACDMHIEMMSYVVQCVCSDMLARVLKISLPINGRELRGETGWYNELH